MRHLRAALLVLLASTAGSPALDRPADAQVQRAIAALRRDGSLKVRAQAAFVLAQRGAREAVPALERALSEDEAAAVRVAAATALGRIGGQGVVAALRDAAGHDRDGAVRSAAGRALDAILRETRTVVLEEVRGGRGDAAARDRFHDALAVQLQRHGFAVVGGGQEVGYTLKPSVLLVQQAQSGTWLTLEVKASVVAIDGQGRIAAMVEGGARARTAAPGAGAHLAAQALDAAARSICEDLARRLLELE